jgi:hypothetical protein
MKKSQQVYVIMGGWTYEGRMSFGVGIDGATEGSGYQAWARTEKFIANHSACQKSV